MTLEARLFAWGIGSLLLIGLCFWAFMTVYDNGKKEGANSVQVQWDANRAAIAKVTAEALAKANKDRDEALQANEAIHEKYVQDLAAAAAGAQSLTARLRDAENRASAYSRSLSQANNQQRPASGASPPSVGQLNEATGAALAECASYRAWGHALIAELKPQL